MDYSRLFVQKGQKPALKSRNLISEGEEMNSGKNRLFAAMLAIVLAVSLTFVPSVLAAEDNKESVEADQSLTGTSVSGEYEKYLKDHQDKENAKEDIVINPLDYTKVEGNEFSLNGNTLSSINAGKYSVLLDALKDERVTKDCLVWSDNDTFKQQGKVVYTITVPEDGFYNVMFRYLPLTKTGATAAKDDDRQSKSPVELSLLIDGKTLYKGLDGLSLPRCFINNGATTDKPTGDVRTDSLGNQLTPEQVQYSEFVTAYAIDPVGVVADPYKIFLSKGTHEVTLESLYEPFALADIIFKAPDNTPSYGEYKNLNSGASIYKGDAIEIEGEDAYIKSGNSLVSKADNSSVDIKPNSPVTTILNYIGSTNWATPSQYLTWVVEVPEDGLYELGLNYKQAAVIDGFTYRSLKIDGVIPFEECKSMRFNYGTSWRFETFGNDDEPYLFYLEKGKHTLELTVTLGETAEFYSRLSDIVAVIGNTYIDIVMITGDAPDVNRDYDLFKQIPNFQETLLSTHDALIVLGNDMKALSGDRSNKYISALNNMARVLMSMYENQYTAQTYVKDYYNNYTTVCSWLYEMKTMPLNLDQFQFASPEKGYVDNYASVWESFVFGYKRFVASFSDDFSTIGGSSSVTDAGKVTIWVNWGRDQAQVLSNLIQEDFSSKTGISVNLEIVNASLVKGILAGNFPDLSLHLSRTDPVNLGMRGALYDLTNFSNKKNEKYSTVDDGKNFLLDYETVLKRFQPSADMPYWYEGDKLYALPDTQGFFIMFFRTDIFDSLGMEYPTKANGGMGWTWDDFLDATTTLQRNNMDSYIPYVKIASTTTVNAGMGSLNLFPTFLTQNNVALYNDAGDKTTLTTTEAIEAFTKWTDLYTKYGIVKQADFYNRFRVGTMPLGISSYTHYTQLTQAAPEIQGRWSIAPIPGTLQEDGTLNRSIAGSGSGCSVVAPSENKDAAWQFLCWWTAAETQLRYNNNVESILGAVARTATANIEAFNAYSWNADDLEVLSSQWAEVQELPEVPGGYYVSRAVDQAYWAVLNGKNNSKDAMLEWGKVADDEIIRKIKEYQK